MISGSLRVKDTVWGPKPPSQITPVGPDPVVVSPQQDEHSWGVGEDADHITFSPIFDPVNTQ